MSPTVLTIDNERYLHVREAARRANVVPDYMSQLAAQPRAPPQERSGKRGETLPLPKMGPERMDSYGSPTSSREQPARNANPGELPMKIILSALVALSFLATVAPPASAFDAKSFYDQQDRQAN